MTREEKLYSMTMANLQIVADKLGVKINKKAAKSQAVAKILEAENANWEEEANKEKEAQEKKQAAKDKAAEDAINKPKLVQMPGTEDPNWGEKHYAPKPKRGALIEWNGKSQNICAWAKELGKNPNTLYARIYKMNWSIEKAFTK